MFFDLVSLVTSTGKPIPLTFRVSPTTGISPFFRVSSSLSTRPSGMLPSMMVAFLASSLALAAQQHYVARFLRFLRRPKKS